MYRSNYKDDFKWIYRYFVSCMNVNGDMSENELSTAIRVCELALELNSRDIYAYLGLSFLLSEKKESERALKMANTAVELNSKNFEAYFRLGKTLDS